MERKLFQIDRGRRTADKGSEVKGKTRPLIEMGGVVEGTADQSMICEQGKDQINSFLWQLIKKPPRFPTLF